MSYRGGIIIPEETSKQDVKFSLSVMITTNSSMFEPKITDPLWNDLKIRLQTRKRKNKNNKKEKYASKKIEASSSFVRPYSIYVISCLYFHY